MALEVIITTNYGVTSDDEVGIMTTPGQDHLRKIYYMTKTSTKFYTWQTHIYKLVMWQNHDDLDKILYLIQQM